MAVSIENMCDLPGSLVFGREGDTGDKLPNQRPVIAAQSTSIAVQSNKVRYCSRKKRLWLVPTS